MNTKYLALAALVSASGLCSHAQQPFGADSTTLPLPNIGTVITTTVTTVTRCQETTPGEYECTVGPPPERTTNQGTGPGPGTGAGIPSSTLGQTNAGNSNVIPAVDTTGTGPSAPQSGMPMCEQPGQPVSPGTGPGPCGSMPIPADDCSQGMTGNNAIIQAWQFNLEDNLGSRIGNSMRFGFQHNHAMVFRFKTKGPGEIARLNQSPWHGLLQVSFDEYIPAGGIVKKFISISEKRCDFDYGKLYVPGQALESVPPDSGCYRSEVMGAVLGKIWASGHEKDLPLVERISHCSMKPDTVYYLNIRYEDATPAFSDAGGRPIGGNQGWGTCTPNQRGPMGTCGNVFNFNGD